MKLSLKASTIYPKLVLSFLLIIIPIFVTSLLMNRSGQDAVKQQITESMASRVHFYLTTLETELQRLSRLKLEYVNDDELISLGTMAERMDDFERSRAILSTKNKLYLLKSSSPLVENVKLYISGLDRSVAANSYDDTIPDDELQAILEPDNMRSAIFDFEGRLLISGVYPDAIYVDREPVLAVEIELSRRELSRTLSSIAGGEHGGAALIPANQAWTIAADVESELLEQAAGMVRAADLGRGPKHQANLASSGDDYFVAYEYSEALDMALAVFVPARTVLKPLDQHQSWLWSFSLISLLVIGVFSYWIYRLIHQPIKRLVIAFRKVEKGDLGIRAYHRNRDEFHYLYSQFNHMVERIQQLIHEVYEQQIRSQQSELKQLQSQINPHFFYNSFFILQGLVRMNDNELAERMLGHLGSYFQFITRTGADNIPLQLEMKHATAYVEIQNIRFAETIRVRMDEVPDGWGRVLVPRLAIQPLLENAYVHGLENKLEGGRLEVRFREMEGGNILVIEVEDNGDGVDEAKLSSLRQWLAASGQALETTGILNVHRRLQLAHGSDCGIQVSRGELGGMKVQVTIKREEEERQ